jgi:anti-anti-sigma factor
MEITKTKNDAGDMITLKVRGKLSAATTEEFDVVLGGAVEEGADIVLDFEGLDYLASAGLRCLIAAHKKIRAGKKGGLSIINLTDTVREVFEITGLEDIFDIK